MGQLVEGIVGEMLMSITRSIQVEASGPASTYLACFLTWLKPGLDPGWIDGRDRPPHHEAASAWPWSHRRARSRPPAPQGRDGSRA